MAVFNNNISMKICGAESYYLINWIKINIDRCWIFYYNRLLITIVQTFVKWMAWRCHFITLQLLKNFLFLTIYSDVIYLNSLIIYRGITKFRVYGIPPSRTGLRRRLRDSAFAYGISPPVHTVFSRRLL